MNYKINSEDLIGELENFPIEVVEKMLEYQVKQGNALTIQELADSIEVELLRIKK